MTAVLREALATSVSPEVVEERHEVVATTFRSVLSRLVTYFIEHDDLYLNALWSGVVTQQLEDCAFQAVAFTNQKTKASDGSLLALRSFTTQKLQVLVARAATKNVLKPFKTMW